MHLGIEESFLFAYFLKNDTHKPKPKLPAALRDNRSFDNGWLESASPRLMNSAKHPRTTAFVVKEVHPQRQKEKNSLPTLWYCVRLVK